MNEIALEFDRVSFRYDNGKKNIINSLNLKVENGEFVSIIGPSGSGKSTIFRLITGLETPTSGSILVNGIPMNDRLGSVGYMPQQDLLLPWRTVLENVVLPIELKKNKRTWSKAEMVALLDEFGLKGYENQYPANLSGGMRQRVSFLRTIMTGSNILLLDEPFSALDAITRLMMQEWLIEKWDKYKQTILFITHDVDEALLLSDRILVLTDHPISSLKEVYVPLERPRRIRDFGEQKIIEIKEQLIEQLRFGVK
ncbi:ABC transporter ATP-binding protein [Bacillus sp. Marseille-P3661]|uniref:ABC transporter ATP-binding protein n=1 Tax=Bacillus sp. Marseille-P3661 TaxID=1936234 RepID=UPI000C8510E4|nr:ABC transporter ATP-binding protein [Bacillus sp. Marseille-P3661]